MIKETKRDGNWIIGKAGTFYWEIKRYETGSIYGIEEGRISKLYIKRTANLTEITANYDRGWDIEPQDIETKRLYNELIKKYN